MRLRSSERSKSEKPESDYCMENHDAVECVTVGIKEELKSSVPNSPNKLVVECENRSDDVETKIIFDEDADIKIVNGDEDEKPSLDDSETSRDFDILKEKMKIEEIKEANENVKGVLEVKKGKRGRKRKVLESSGDVMPVKEEVGVKVNRRVLRSNSTTVNDGVKVDESRLNESVVGFKKQMEAECLGQTEIKKKVNEKSQPTGRPEKKQKRRGRPPKIQGETGSKRKIVLQSACLDENALQKEADEKQEKKQKLVLHKVPVIDNSKRHGRPAKGQEGNLSTLITNEKKQKTNQLKGKNVKDSPKIHNVQKEAESPEDDNKPKINTFDDQSQTTVEETEKSQTTKQLVRDKISSMIMKAGWVIELRKRQNKEYLDAVYVDQKGKTNWSVTKAYFSLLKKIEKGVANDKEISAFTPIPNEELSILFRSVSKIRSDKNMKKEKIIKGKNKAEIIITGVEQLKEHKRKCIKKSNQRGPKVKPRLVARTTNKVPDQENADCTLFDGKRNLLSWMIDTGAIMPGGKLQYGERKHNEGKITRDGINCDCCNKIMDISSFVKHCGGKCNEGFENIYLESGSSFLKCLLESWRKEENSGNIRFNDVDISGDDPNDDTCNICGDGGDLICCDGCPSTFHQSCLDIQDFPSGDWRCIYCCCKFCGLVEDTAEMLTCCLCEEKFHNLCLQEEVDSSSLSFCGKKCQEIHEQVQKYHGVKFELEDGFSWSLVKRCDISQVVAVTDDELKIECNSKLAVAFSVMDECFVPIMDERSGVNVIHNVVYNCGSNIRRLDYSGFFTAILERGGELISAASIRIHGQRLAEMPFIGTRNMYRRQGMCRRLLDAIENALSCIGVGELVIPAIPELFKTWTKVFGFKPLKESKRREMRCMSMVVFPGTDMLQKPLLNNRVPVPDDKTVEHTVMNDDGALRSKTKLPSAITVVKTSPLTSPRISLDLNIQPAATDDESISRDPQVCKDAFDNGSQPLVLV